MSLIIDADNEYLTGTGFSGGTGNTEMSVAVWVKRNSGTSNSQAYMGIGPDFDDNWNVIDIAHNGTGADCWVYPQNSQYRIIAGPNANSTAWQLLVLTFKQNAAPKVYTAITGGSVSTYTHGTTPTEYFSDLVDSVRIGKGGFSTADWYCRARLAHAAVWNKELTSAQVSELFNGGTAGAGKNPQAVQAANLKFYSPLTSDATVTVGGISLSATGTLTYDGADNPNVEAYGSTQNVTVANVTQANSISGAAVYQATANGILTTAPLKNNTRTLLANISGWTVDVKNPTTGALVVRVTGLTTSSLGVLTVNDALIVAGTSYALEPSHATYGRILPVLTAT